MLETSKAMQVGLFLGPNFAANYYHMAIIRQRMTRKVPEFFPELFDEVKVSFERFLPMEKGKRAVKYFVASLMRFR